jgi:hypothetical protein
VLTQLTGPPPFETAAAPFWSGPQGMPSAGRVSSPLGVVVAGVVDFGDVALARVVVVTGVATLLVVVGADDEVTTGGGGFITGAGGIGGSGAIDG